MRRIGFVLAVLASLAAASRPAAAQIYDEPPPDPGWYEPDPRWIEPPVESRPLPPPGEGWVPGPYDSPSVPPTQEPPPGDGPAFGDDPLMRPPDRRAPDALPPETSPPAAGPEGSDAPVETPSPGAPSSEVEPLPNVQDPAPKGIAEPPTLSPERMIDEANAAAFGPDADLGNRTAGKLAQSPLVVKLQVLLDRAGMSPGVIDGYYGYNVQKAVAAFESFTGQPVDGVVDADVWTLLEMTSPEAVLVPYTITEADAEGPFEPDLPSDYGEMAKLQSLAYRGPAEMLAERFHMDEKFLRQLNPAADLGVPGTTIAVADPGRPARGKVEHVVADKRTKQVIGYDADGRIVVAYPATIGSADLPSPTGRHVVEAIAVDPEYWYRPDVNFRQGGNLKALRLPPGPNGPVGSVWIDLSEPTYGMHGTPEPSKIDKGFSHGCVRLTNWDANELAHLVAKGVPVDFMD